MIESYIKRNDVIKCELNLTFTEKSIHYLTFTDHCRENADKLLIVAKTLINFLFDFIIFIIIYFEHYVKMQIMFKCRTHFVRLRMLILMSYTIYIIKRC
jgi:hypothetical protein